MGSPAPARENELVAALRRASPSRQFGALVRTAAWDFSEPPETDPSSA